MNSPKEIKNLKIFKIFLLCPIPEEQKPILQYISLKKNKFLSVISFQRKNLFFQIFFFFCFNIFLFSFFSKELFFFIKIFFKNFFFIFNFFFFFFSIIFILWNQLKSRFNQARLFYEEASWYDGQLWEKPFSIIKNDRFLSTQKLSPFLEIIKKYFFLSLFLNLVFFIFFFLK